MLALFRTHVPSLFLSRSLSPRRGRARHALVGYCRRPREERCLGSPFRAPAHNTDRANTPVRIAHTETQLRPSHPTYDNPVVCARLLSSAADLRVARRRARVLSFPLTLSLSLLSRSSSFSLASRNCRHGTRSRSSTAGTTLLSLSLSLSLALSFSPSLSLSLFLLSSLPHSLSLALSLSFSFSLSLQENTFGTHHSEMPHTER